MAGNSRVLFQGSRLLLLRALEIHDAEDMLGLPKDLSAKQLYSNLNWLENNQLSIEKKLQKIHKVKANLYLYDVTSSYLEGANNELADYGYNRDKKKGKKQIVIGLLTNSEGMPVAVRVFKGNTSDSKTIPDQINLLRNDFLIKKVTLVGDRAMFPQRKKMIYQSKFLIIMLSVKDKSRPCSKTNNYRCLYSTKIYKR